MTLDVPVPCLDNIFMVLLISALATIAIGATKPIFLDSGSPRGGGGGSCMRACMGMVCYHCIVHILNSSKKTYFFVSNSDLSELCFQTTLGHIPLL